MQIKYSSSFESKYKKLVKKNKSLQKKIAQKIDLLSSNPKHPSLRLHKIESKFDAWSISVNMNLRILFVYRSYGILLVDIGGHDEVY